jgi:uncharacterized protein YjbI with pentapeptide repeats
MSRSIALGADSVAPDGTVADLAGRNLMGADLRGADLAGRDLTRADLRDARLDGADLRGATIRLADLTGASLCHATLDGATFDLVRGGGLQLQGVSAVGLWADRCHLAGADLTGAQLTRSTWRACGLEGAVLDEADLTDASLAWSDLSQSTLKGTTLARAITLGTRLDGADLHQTRDFAFCREVVVEVLLRHGGDDPEVVPLIGAISLQRNQCYPVWAALVADRRDLIVRAGEAFAQYPASGCLEAFHAALVAARSDR